VNWPVPRSGLVIRYSYLWESEARAGREEGVKDRPCAIILVVLREGEHPIVRVLPVTHSPPADLADDFIRPGPDLRPAVSGDLSSVAYGMLPPGFMAVLRERLAQRWREKRVAVRMRTE
jgi:hypothetical protein